MNVPQRRAAIVLAVTSALGGAIVLTLNRAVLGRFPNDVESGLGMGTLLALTVLAAGWAALGPLPLGRRLLLSALWAIGWGIVAACSARLSGAEFESVLSVLFAPFIVVLLWLLLEIPFWLLGLAYGWHVQDAAEAAANPEHLKRFGWRQWLWGMVWYGLLVASGITAVVLLDDREYWQLRRNLFDATVAVSSVLSCILLVIASLLPRRAAPWTGVTILAIALATYATARLIQYCQYSSPDGWPIYVTTQATTAVWICAVIAAIRWSGYRLTATRAKLPLPAWLQPSPRFSLRTLLILTAVVGVIVGYFGNLWRRVSRQRAVVAKIEAAGGDVSYQWQFGMGEELDAPQVGRGWSWGYKKNPTDLGERTRVVDGKTITQREAYPGPWIVRRFVGDDAFWQIESVDFWDLETGPTGELELQRPGELEPELLKELPDLRILRLMYNQVDDTWLGAASAAPKLQSLSLLGHDKGTATRAGIETLQRTKRLRRLDLAGDWVSDDTMRGVATLSQLESLTIAAPNVTAAGYAQLQHLTELRELSLNHEKTIDDSATVAFPHLHHLRTLSLMKTSVSDITLARLAQLTELEELILLETNISDQGMESLADLRNLKTLYLARTEVGDAGMEALAGLPQLKTLYAPHTQIGNAGVASLARLPSLTYLNLGGTKITDAALPTLSGMTQLKNLTLWPCDITDEGLPHLTNLQNLRELGIGPDISKEAVNRLRAALPNCNIRRIDASGSSSWPE